MSHAFVICFSALTPDYIMGTALKEKEGPHLPQQQNHPYHQCEVKNSIYWLSNLGGVQSKIKGSRDEIVLRTYQCF